jgi:hypothetical protein
VTRQARGGDWPPAPSDDTIPASPVSAHPPRPIRRTSSQIFPNARIKSRSNEIGKFRQPYSSLTIRLPSLGGVAARHLGGNEVRGARRKLWPFFGNKNRSYHPSTGNWAVMSYNPNGEKLEGDVERPVLPGLRVGGEKLDGDGNVVGDNDSSVLVESEEGHQIKYKTLTWKKVPTHDLGRKSNCRPRRYFFANTSGDSSGVWGLIVVLQSCPSPGVSVSLALSVASSSPSAWPA